MPVATTPAASFHKYLRNKGFMGQIKGGQSLWPFINAEMAA